MKRKSLLAGLTIMTIGFAELSTTLYINGTANIVKNTDDFTAHEFSEMKKHALLNFNYAISEEIFNVSKEEVTSTVYEQDNDIGSTDKKQEAIPLAFSLPSCLRELQKLPLNNPLYQLKAGAFVVTYVAYLVAFKAANNRYVQRVVDNPVSPPRPVRLGICYPVCALPCGRCERPAAYLANAAAYGQGVLSLPGLRLIHRAPRLM